MACRQPADAGICVEEKKKVSAIKKNKITKKCESDKMKYICMTNAEAWLMASFIKQCHD